MLVNCIDVAVFSTLVQSKATALEEIWDYSGDISTQTHQPIRGDPVTIHCETTIADSETLAWLKDDVNIELLPAQLSYIVSNNSLHIQSYDREYDGFYRCISRHDNNTAGSVVQTQVSVPIVLTSFGKEVMMQVCYANSCVFSYKLRI